jgi:type II secretory pathway component GspD/PulD (secretin)
MKYGFAHAGMILALLCSDIAASTSPRFSFDSHDSQLTDVIRLLAVQSGMNLVADDSIKPQRVSLRLSDVSFDEVLQTLRDAYGLQIHRSGRIYIIGTAAAMSRRFPDADLDGGTTTATLTPARGSVDDVRAALVDALPAGTVVVANKRSGSIVVTGSAATVERARSLLAAFGPTGATAAPPVQTATVALRNLRATDAVKLLKGAVPDNVLIPDDRQNTVVISGDAALADQARSLLTAIDNPGKQVMFEVRVADVQPINDSSNVGFEFGGASYGAGALGAFPYTLTKSSVTVDAQLNTLIQSGHASILAQPRIATINNHEATLLVGETYPVVTVNLQTGFPSVTNIDVGVKLRLTPSIGADGTITADFHPEFSQITGFNATFPIVSNRRVDSTLRLRDGDTIVLGGLFSDIDSETITKFPLLGDIPGLGAFFRNKERTHNKDEVVFYITPHLM